MAIPKNNDYIAKISLINPKMAVERGGIQNQHPAVLMVVYENVFPFK